MRLLVTGGTGFLGSEFLKLCGGKYEVVAIYRNKPGFDKNIKWVKLNLATKQDFLRHYDELRRLKIDAIVHIGGATPNRAAIDGNYEATTTGTKNLLEMMSVVGINKIVYISTISILTECPGMYAKSKIEAEKMVKESGKKFVIIRPGTIFGEGAVDFNKLIRIIKKVPFIPVVEPDQSLYQPIAVTDLVRIIDTCISSDMLNGKEFFAVGPEIITMRSLLGLAAKKCDTKIVIVAIPKYLALFIAGLAERVLPKSGLTKERVYLQNMKKRVKFLYRKYFDFEFQDVDSMLNFLRI